MILQCHKMKLKQTLTRQQWAPDLDSSWKDIDANINQKVCQYAHNAQQNWLSQRTLFNWACIERCCVTQYYVRWRIRVCQHWQKAGPVFKRDYHCRDAEGKVRAAVLRRSARDVLTNGLLRVELLGHVDMSTFIWRQYYELSCVFVTLEQFWTSDQSNRIYNWCNCICDVMTIAYDEPQTQRKGFIVRTDS